MTKETMEGAVGGGATSARGRWWHRHSPWIVAATGLFATVALWFLVGAFEERAVRKHFELDAEERLLAISDELDHSLEVLEYLYSMHVVLEEPTREEFAAFTRPILDRNHAIRALGWNPVVRRSERAAHVARQRATGDPGYRITERDPAGEMVAAGDRPTHVVVAFLEPYEGNENALGYDIASEVRRRRAVESARDSGELRSTEAIRLVQEPADERSILAALPVYRGFTTPETVEERREALVGYVVGAFRIGDIVSEALKGFDDVGMHVALRDTLSAPENDRLYSAVQGPDHPRIDGNELVPEYRETRTIECAGRTWEAELTATDSYLDGLHGRGREWVVLFGLLVTAWLVLLQTRIRRHLSRVEQLIAERRRAEHAVRSSEERHRLTLESITDGVWDWNLATKELVIAGTPPTASSETAREDAEHRLFDGVVHPEDLAFVRTALAEHFEGRTSLFECECRLRVPSGEYRWFLRRGKVVARDEDDAPLRMVGSDTDVTQERAAEERNRLLEEQARHSQKLESLGVLTGGIAHDFNNILTGVLGNTELAQLKLAAGEPVTDELERVRASAMHAADLVRQMLAYAGKGRAVSEPVNLDRVLEEMLDLLRASLTKKATLETDLEPDTRVVGDPSQLRQVFMNLVLNASESIGDESGTIRLRARRDRVERDELDQFLRGEELGAGEYVRAEVEDTGCGMDASTLDSLFEPFFTTKFQGRGLGLSAVIGIVSSHGGAIRVRSESGRGSTFEILLPYSTDEIVTPRPPLPSVPAGAPAGGGGCVLVVDDEEPVLCLASKMLERAGYCVLTAPDGEQALELFRKHADRLVAVLLDQMMPRLSGRETFEAMHALHPEIPVVLSSGYNEETTLQDLEGVAGFVPKPFRAAALVSAVREAARKPART